MEIQQTDPPDVVREKLETGFARAYGPCDEAARAAHVVGVFLGFDITDADTALTGVPTQPQA